MSRFTKTLGAGRYTLHTGYDHAVGNFLQLQDAKLISEDSEGYILDIDELFGCTINSTGLMPTQDTFMCYVVMLIEYLLKNGIK